MINKTYLISIAIAGGALLLWNVIGEASGPVTAQVLSLLTLPPLFVSFCVFIYGLIRYIWGRYKKNDVLKEHGKKFMFWALIALFASIAIWFFIGYITTSPNDVQGYVI